MCVLNQNFWSRFWWSPEASARNPLKCLQAWSLSLSLSLSLDHRSAWMPLTHTSTDDLWVFSLSSQRLDWTCKSYYSMTDIPFTSYLLRSLSNLSKSLFSLTKLIAFNARFVLDQQSASAGWPSMIHLVTIGKHWKTRLSWRAHFSIRTSNLEAAHSEYSSGRAGR